jgi:hypothetical protein
MMYLTGLFSIGMNELRGIKIKEIKPEIVLQAIQKREQIWPVIYEPATACGIIKNLIVCCFFKLRPSTGINLHFGRLNRGKAGTIKNGL